VNLDVGTAVRRAVGALPAIRALEPEIRRMAPHFSLDTIAEVEEYALATWYAHAVLEPVRGMAVVTNARVQEARKLKATLLVSAGALAHHGYLDAKTVAAIPKQASHVRTADDLLALAAMIQNIWPRVQNHVPVGEEELERAQAVGTDLVLALGARLQPGAKEPKRAASLSRRARAFTLFMRAYDDCRRVVAYVRGAEGDADRIAPSLYTKKRISDRKHAALDDVRADASAGGGEDAGGAR
jgi:hypothetical protein